MSKFDFLRQDYDNKILALQHEAESKIATLQISFDLTKEADKAALALALHSLNERLNGMNEFRDALSDQSNRMMTRSETEAVIAVLADKVEKQGRPNYGAWIAGVAAVIALFGGLWGGIVLLVNNGQASQTSLITAVQTADLNRDRVLDKQQESLNVLRDRSVAGAQDDASSREDRLQLNNRLAMVETLQRDGIADRKAKEALIAERLVNINGKLSAMSNIINSGKDTADRWLAILYEKVFPGQRMPAENWRPQLYNPDIAPPP